MLDYATGWEPVDGSMDWKKLSSSALNRNQSFRISTGRTSEIRTGIRNAFFGVPEPHAWFHQLYRINTRTEGLILH